VSLLNNLFARGKKKAEPPPAEMKKGAESAPEQEEVIKLKIETPTPPAVGRPPAGEQVPEPAAPPLSDLDDIRRQLLEIERIIGEETAPAETGTTEEEKKEAPAAQVVNIRAVTLLSALPTELLTEKASQVPDDLRVSLGITDLFDQLAKGKVVVSMREAALALPQGTLSPEWEKQAERPISLPLPEVVAAIPPDELRKRMTLEEDERAKTPIPDLFRPHAAAAGEEAGEAAATPAATAEAEKAPPEEPAAAVSQAAQTAEARAPQGEETGEAVPALGTGETVESAAPAAVEQTARQPEEAVAEAAAAEEVVQTAAGPTETAAPPQPQEPSPAQEEIPAPPGQEVEAPAKEEVELPAAAPLPEETGPVAAEVPAGTAAAEPVPVPGRPEEEALEHPYLFVRGIDLNRASAEEIADRVDGVGPELARRIVADREVNGPFFDVLDLARVRGLGRRALESILGRPVSVQMYRYVPEIRRILGESRVPDVRTVAHNLAQLPGIEGCVIAHREGYRVTTTAASADSDKLAAFAPQIYKKLAWYIRQLDIGGLQSVTLLVESRPITIVRGGELYLVLLHCTGQLKRKQIYLAHAVAAELSRRLQGS